MTCEVIPAMTSVEVNGETWMPRHARLGDTVAFIKRSTLRPRSPRRIACEEMPRLRLCLSDGAQGGCVTSRMNPPSPGCGSCPQRQGDGRLAAHAGGRPALAVLTIVVARVPSGFGGPWSGRAKTSVATMDRVGGTVVTHEPLLPQPAPQRGDGRPHGRIGWSYTRCCSSCVRIHLEYLAPGGLASVGQRRLAAGSDALSRK